MAKKNNDANIVTMVNRACKILEMLYKCDKFIGVSKLSQELDLPKATVYRILYTLQQWGFVDKIEDTDKYKLGLVFIQYGERVKLNMDLKTIAQPYMERLASEIGETVNLGVNYEDSVLAIHTEKGEESVLISRLTPLSPLYCSSMGKIFLSGFNEKQLKEYFNSNRIVSRTVKTITNLDKIKEEIKKIKKEKVAFDNEEYEYGLTCIAAPVINKKNEIIAALSISGPTSRLEFKDINKITEKLKETAKQISQKAEMVEK
jgi:IclR family KDG regulon transcriptional repressor